MLKFLNNQIKSELELKNNKNSFNLPQIKKGNKIESSSHFPATTEHWYNSIYSFNRNNEKSIFHLDTIVNNLVKMYFNLISNIDKSLRFARRRNKVRHYSTNRIFVSRADIKHYNDRVLITLFTYNRTKKDYFNKLNYYYRNILGVNKVVSSRNRKFKNMSNKYLYNNKYKNYNKLHFFRYLSVLYRSEFINNMFLHSKFNDIYLKYSNMFNKFIVRSNIINKLIINKKLTNINRHMNKNNLLNVVDINNIDNIEKNKKILFNEFINNSLKNEVSFLKYNQRLLVDTYKYSNIYLSRLNSIVSNIYNKKVEFNIINLKYPHLDTKIFSDSIDIKMQNRKNQPIRILKKAWSLPVISNMRTYKYNSHKLYRNSYNSLSVYNIYNKSKNNIQDILNSILSNMFVVKNIYDSNKVKDKFAYRSIRFRKVGGIRWEAKGRITKRLTASRSANKAIYKGSLKNIDSSINRLSSVLSRGHLYSNLDYLNINSKTRNGCFGLKGWISSK